MKIADSLMLAVAGCLSLLLGRLWQSAWGYDVFPMLMFFVLAPVLAIVAACFAVRDLRNRMLRWQAGIALVASASIFLYGALMRW